MKQLRFFSRYHFVGRLGASSNAFAWYSFYMIGSDFGIYDHVTDPKSFHLVDSVEVNTFSVPRKGWLASRFVADNPGM